MKVRVEMTLDIDDHVFKEHEQVWGLTTPEYRQYVKDYADSLVRGYMAERGLLTPTAPPAASTYDDGHQGCACEVTR